MTRDTIINRVLDRICNCRKWAEEYKYEVCSADEWLCSQINPFSLCELIDKCKECPECSSCCEIINQLLELC